jgi:UDP-2,3-diacylglucosamine pyrophosphatase LpxH
MISDLHLTDGSSGMTVSPGAFQIFAERLEELARAASWRTDGSYRPVDRIDVVLLGDVLDVIRSTQWNAQPSPRPWSDSSSGEFIAKVNQITDGILSINEESLAVLRRLSGEGLVRIPPALRSGRPSAAASQLVPVRIFYMVGNHDWFFHLSGEPYNLIRKKIVDRMGLSQRPEAPFPHDMVECEDLLAILRRHKVTARHGDLFDPFNFEGDRDVSSLGDAIVVELLNRFAVEVETQLANELPAATIVGLRELDNVRPLMLMPVWIDGLLERTCSFPSMRKRVKTVWDRVVDDFLAIDFVRQRDTWSPNDLVDGLQGALKFSKRMSVGWASSILEWLNGIRGSTAGSYASMAMAEQDFRNRRSKHIVYGHTHAAESVPLDASYAEGYVLNQMYFNCGTWRRVHRQTQLAPNEHEFIADDVMTYLVFFQGDERKGRPYETWSGTLGFNPSEITVHRIDPGRPRHATGEPLSAPGLQGHAPHFTAPARQAGNLPARRV